MAATTPTTGTTRTSSRESRDGRRDAAVLVTRTEARRAFVTTEFWIAIAMAAAVIIAAYVNDGVDIELDQAWAIGAGVVAFYVLSRGIAKAGSSDPEIKHINVD
jgi:hypothetical protein